MKLYTFTVTDEFGASVEDIYEDARKILAEEAVLQDWNDDYFFDMCSQPEQLPDGSTRYQFEVEGTYDVGEGDAERSGATALPKVSSTKAAKEVENG